MTRDELSAALQALPENLPVYLADWNECAVPPCELKSGEVVILDRRACWDGKTVEVRRIILLGAE